MGTAESILANEGAPPDPPAANDRQDGSRPSQSHHSSSRNRPRRPSRRSRPPLSPLVTLNGLVLGLTGSGKRTLLKRLAGKDPFVDETPDETDDGPQEIIIPYQPPPKSTVWDRIQLHVAIQPSDVPSVDFCVVLVHPRHDARNLKPYIARLLTMLLKQQQQHGAPLCICFLINFRDLQGDRYPRISCQDVESWAREVLKQDSRRDYVLLQCTTTSLKNCYGLSSLHHFIYQSYLRYKQAELQQRLQQVQSILDAQNENGIPTVAYESFLQVLKQAESSMTATVEEGVSDHEQGESDNGKERPGGSKRTEHQHDRRKQHSDSNDDGRPVNGRQEATKRPKPSRSILPKTYANPKQSLDDFFADDDDDEEDIVTPVTSNHAVGRHDRYHASSEEEEQDDDEDDDFYYDEGGHRHQHGGVVEDDSSSGDEKDHASIESLDSQIAHAREHSIIDSEENEAGEACHAEIPTDVSPKSDNVAGEGDVNGWDDDEIDLGDSDDDHETAVPTDGTASTGDSKRPTQKEQVTDEKTDDGWDVDEDLGLESDEDPVATIDETPTGAKPPANDEAESTTVDIHDGEEDEDNAHIVKDGKVRDSDDPPDSPSGESGATNAVNGEEHSSSPAASHEVAPEEETTEAVEPTEGESGSQSVATEDLVSQPTTARDDDSSDEDDDFIVEDTTPTTSISSQQESIPTEPQESTDTKDRPASSTPVATSSSSGISAAALAAIAAAEKEAQVMMRQQQDDDAATNGQPRKLEKKKSKKKKDPDAKKKKKKRHKEKRKEASLDGSYR